MAQDTYLAYPLKFRPIFKEKTWGGQNLKRLFGRPLPPNKKIGESWEIACLNGDVSIVSNGPYEGRRFNDLLEQFPEQILGLEVMEKFPDRFPLLFKLLDACEPISVQVHPADDVAAENEDGQWGKMEMWHILAAQPEAKVACGLKDWVRPDNLENLLLNGQIQDALEMIPVTAGDTVFIPPGRVHATQGSLVFLEVQENSDLTYRLYDWERQIPGRQRRPLQIEKGIQSVAFHDEEESLVNPIVTKKNEVEERLLVTCDYFTVERVSVPIFYQDNCDGDKFRVYFIASGKGEICPQGMSEESMAFKQGDFLFLPASLGAFEIQTDTSCDIIKTIVT